jgi:hypothetical protein
MNSIDKRRGQYLGTEVDEKWWRRYSKDGLLLRGTGEYRYDPSAFFFRRYLTTEPIVILFADVLDVKVGKWHSGRWSSGAQVIKLVWKKADTYLSSGFVLSSDTQESDLLVQKLQSLYAKQTAREE